MPIYDYHCNQCNVDFEKMSSIGDRDKASCQHCGEKNISRKVTACNHNVMRGNDDEIQRAITEQDSVCKDQKLRVKKALSGLVPKDGDTKSGPMGCVHQTRLDLKDRYGDIL